MNKEKLYRGTEMNPLWRGGEDLGGGGPQQDLVRRGQGRGVGFVACGMSRIAIGERENTKQTRVATTLVLGFCPIYTFVIDRNQYRPIKPVGPIDCRVLKKSTGAATR